MTPSSDVTTLDRRRALQLLPQATIATTLSTTLAPHAAQATDLVKFNKKLDSLGLAELSEIPNGFNAAVESYTQSMPKLWVQFFYPSSWLFIKPSQNTNGESGTISAGDYGKGDSAALFVGDGGKGANLKDKKFLASTIIAGISQRGDNQYQNFDLGKVTTGGEPNYVLVDFNYELLTGAGFVVERKGVASLTTLGDAVPALIAVTTAARYKKIKDQLLTSASSFRAFEKASSIAAPAFPADD
eukprot:CAMPEP_0198665682 /NCGR_PEP_ID=MMETSP1467-20131203/61514_1 /TAXON_ID=1462469 /ORGANISM="unid. sp., Strain CCMP2135" /LENGTH=242 /DNA_ID=CAMNT_0044402285 /DNA_START=46 /DNA_END=774 /DNA_ORIENTATION=-